MGRRGGLVAGLLGGFGGDAGVLGGLVGWFGVVGVVWACVFQGGVFTGGREGGCQQSWGKARRLSRMVW